MPQSAQRLLRQAERDLKIVTSTDNDYSTRAADRRIQVIRLLVGDAEKTPAKINSFDEAVMAAQVQLYRAVNETEKPEDRNQMLTKVLALYKRARQLPVPPDAAREAVEVQTRRFLGIKGKRTVDSFHRELGKLMWDKCGMARNAAGLREALQRIPQIREEFWRNVNVPGSDAELNQALEKAGRVADFLELGELMCLDALHREESCGGHFREEHQTEDGEALRDDENFAHVSAWEWTGDANAPVEHREQLEYATVAMSTRSYK